MRVIERRWLRDEVVSPNYFFLVRKLIIRTTRDVNRGQAMHTTYVESANLETSLA